MRIRFKPTPEQRVGLRALLDRFGEADYVRLLLTPLVDEKLGGGPVRCTRQNSHSDRFVLKVELRNADGEDISYAVKTYSDDFGSNVWTYAETLRRHFDDEDDGVCLPLGYDGPRKTLVFPWIEGETLSKIVAERKPELLKRAGRLAARLHRLSVVPEDVGRLETILQETRGRCDRARKIRHGAAAVVEPLWEQVSAAAGYLAPWKPAPIHGDLAAGQFVWTGSRLVLLDLDMYGYFDPAYDVGHFLAQLQRRLIIDGDLPIHSRGWAADFLETYRSMNPEVSLTNISFYFALTMLRKIYTICRRFPNGWTGIAPRIAKSAHDVLGSVYRGPGADKNSTVPEVG